jgi:DnaJ-like protein
MFNRIAENRIREAIERGEFDNLPGAGQPLNLEAYFSTPEDLRMAYSVLKNANCRPLEVELLNEIARLQQAVSTAPDPTAREPLERQLADRRTELAILLERRPRSSK